MKLVFLLEEQSMKYLLDELLPRILPQGVEFQTVPHAGKRALEKAIPIKLRAWNEPGDVRFVVVHDQDSKDCRQLKQQLVDMCQGTGKQVLIRIACQELEAWYFGDLAAMEQAYGKKKLAVLADKQQYRVPDLIPRPKEALYKLLPEHQQIGGARRVGPLMDVERNTSTSFQMFVSGVRRLATEAGFPST